MYLTKNFECIFFVEIPGGILHAVVFEITPSGKINFGYVESESSQKVILVDQIGITSQALNFPQEKSQILSLVHIAGSSSLIVFKNRIYLYQAGVLSEPITTRENPRGLVSARFHQDEVMIATLGANIGSINVGELTI